MRAIARSGALVRGDRVFRHKGRGGRLQQTIDVAWTPCHYGGTRPWFLCPDCGRRVAILHAAPHFACRLCHGLYYECQRSRGQWSALVQLQRLRMRLGGSANLTKPFPEKPRFMHHKTFERLRCRGQELEAACVAAITGRFLSP